MDPIKSALVFMATLAFVLSPLLTAGFNGFTPDQFPIPQDHPPIQPAGYAFSIWGLIYVWLMVSATLGMVKHAKNITWEPARAPLIVSLGVGASWLAVAQLSPLWATLQIWVMLVAAIIALFRTPLGHRWILQAPVAIYAGWLTAASFVSIGLIGAGYGIGMGSTGWAYIGLTAALIFAAAVQIKLNRAPEYGATVVWALVAVAIANYGSQIGVTVLAFIGIILMAALAVRAARSSI
jgi:hypothetical protein